MPKSTSDLKKRERELTREIENARDALRAAKHIHLPKGSGRNQLRHLLAKLTAYIGEKVKNRKHVRRRIRHQTKPSKPKSGPDVSQYQGSVDWQKVRGAGHDFAFTKATEGTGWSDPSFSSARLQAMQAAGLRVGAYHFARPDTGGSVADAQQEAASFVQSVKSRGGKFISFAAWKAGRKKGVLGALDFEHTPYSASWAAAWGAEFKRLTGVKAIIYGGGYSLNPVVSALGAFDAVWLAAYVADWHPYFSGNDALVKLWQFTSSASVPGIAGGCDLSHYVG
jgi:lysozyme